MIIFKNRVDLHTIYTMTKFERCDAKCLLQKAGRLPDGIKISKNPVKNFAYFMKNFINNYKLIRKSIKARIGK